MSSPLCSKQNQLQRVLQSHEYLQDRRLKNLSGQPVLILDQSDHKKLFLVFRWNFLYFHLWPFPLILSRGTTKKSLVLSSLHSLLRGAPELSLLQARRTSSLSLILYERWSLDHLRVPLLNVLQCIHVYLVLGSPALETTPRCVNFLLTVSIVEGSHPATCWQCSA